MNNFTQIAHHKQIYLDKATREIWKQVQTKQELEWIAREISIVISDILTFVDMIHECDNRHNFLAVTEEEYPFDQMQKEIEELFEKALELAKYLVSLAHKFEQQSSKIDNLQRLKKTIAELNWMLRKDKSVYESEGYKKLTEEAIREYRAGILEEWPK
jgi:ribosomal protein L29